MPKHDARDLFDYERFLIDVCKYMERQHYTPRGMAHLLDLNVRYVPRLLKVGYYKDYTPSFRTLLLLADLADLSLDAYRLGSGHGPG